MRFMLCIFLLLMMLSCTQGRRINRSASNDFDPNYIDHNTPRIICFNDSDGDGYGAGYPTYLKGTSCPTGFSTHNSDCDDQDPNLISNCQSEITCYVDVDGDGYGAGSPEYFDLESCPSGYSSSNGDCDDNNSDLISNCPNTYECTGVAPKYSCTVSIGGGLGYREGICDTSTGNWVENPNATCILYACTMPNYYPDVDKTFCEVTNFETTCTCDVGNNGKVLATFSAKNENGKRYIKMTANRSYFKSSSPGPSCNMWAEGTTGTCYLDYWNVVFNMSISGNYENLTINGSAKSLTWCLCENSFGGTQTSEWRGVNWCEPNGITKDDGFCIYKCVNHYWQKQTCPGGP